MRKEGHSIHEAPEHNMENKAFHRMGKSNLHASPNHLGDKLMRHEEAEGHMNGPMGNHFNVMKYNEREEKKSNMEHGMHHHRNSIEFDMHHHEHSLRHHHSHHPMGHKAYEKPRGGY